MSAQPLGAILAGGRSSRFGSDKAVARIGGVAMLDCVAARLAPQCAEIVVVGRDWPGVRRVEDRPYPGLGPLGGLAGALAYARNTGHETVLTTGCDLPALPTDLVFTLGDADAVLAAQPTIGLWRSDRADALVAWLAANDRRSLHAWAGTIRARRVETPPIANINRPTDLATFEATIKPPVDPRSSR